MGEHVFFHLELKQLCYFKILHFIGKGEIIDTVAVNVLSGEKMLDCLCS